MNGNKKSKRVSFLWKYIILGVIALAVVLLIFFLSAPTPEKELKTQAKTEEIEREAMERIEALTREVEKPIDLAKADHFVGAQTPLFKKDQRIITTTLKALLEDQGLGPESEIKVVVEEERTVITTPQELLKSRTVHRDTPIRILTEGGQVVETTLRKFLADPSITPDTPIKIIQKAESLIVTTPKELLRSRTVHPDTPIRIVTGGELVTTVTLRKLLADPSITLDTPIKVIDKMGKVIITTPRELQKIALSPEAPIKVIVEKPGEIITLSQLLPKERGVEEGTFYIHSVTGDDVQGIWGIIQHGLMNRFLKGIPVTAEEGFPEGEVLSLKIPELADEPRENGYSSFLGRFLDRKTRESYVYNYTNGRMGRDPDYISPGQELVISRFSNEELIGIYKHFKQKL